MKSPQFELNHLAKLSNLSISQPDKTKLKTQLTSTLQTVSQLSKLNTTKISPTSQVTGLENVTRPDKIDKQRLLSQQQALSGAKRKHRGYFVVPAIFEDQS